MRALQLLDVAVRKARALGHGGDIVGRNYTGLMHEVHGRSMVLSDVYNMLREALGKVRVATSRSGISGKRFHMINPEFLPAELQVALKKVAEAILTVELSALSRIGERLPVGSLLASCDPRIVWVEARYETGFHEYKVGYRCGSHAGDVELTLTIWLVDKPPHIIYIGSSTSQFLSYNI
jgi:hypothetical protein